MCRGIETAARSATRFPGLEGQVPSNGTEYNATDSPIDREEKNVICAVARTCGSADSLLDGASAVRDLLLDERASILLRGSGQLRNHKSLTTARVQQLYGCLTDFRPRAREKADLKGRRR